MNVLPGEPVPPGFEDEVNRVPEIQNAIDLYKGNALIGLEYTIELHEDDRREPGYFCVLCDKRGDPRNIMQHWTSFNHRMKYLEKHYPTAIRELNPIKYKPGSHAIMVEMVQKLTEAIENHHGRLQLTVYGGDEFRRLKSKLLSEVFSKFHHDERNGPNFLNTIDRTLLEGGTTEQTLQITLKRSVNDASNASGGTNQRDVLDDISSDSDAHENMQHKKAKKREQSPAYRIIPNEKKENSANPGRKKDLKLPTPKELSMQASHIAQERYKWEKYNCMLDIQLKEMEKKQLDYEKNPENHPLYPEEWKSFWNRRYKELQQEKKVDPNLYDYKPEWITFWTKRQKQLYNEEIEKKKNEIKFKLGLPEDAVEKVDQLKEKYKVQVVGTAAGANTSTITKSTAGMYSLNRATKHVPNDIIDISDEETPLFCKRSRSHSRKQSRTRSRSNSHSSIRNSRASRKRKNRSREQKRSHSRSRSRSFSSLSELDYKYRVKSGRNSHALASHNSARLEPNEFYLRSHYAGTSAASHHGHAPVLTGHYRLMDPSQYPKYVDPSLRSSKAKDDPIEENESPLTVVAVLRLLTALEEKLGSLGPKVVDLLGKALALEKIKANSADDMLLNEDHCVFFETIKEKLKGLLSADMISDPQQERVVKKAIRNIAGIVHQVSQRGKSDSNDNSNSLSTGASIDGEKESKNAAELPFDRQLVASKLAYLLVKEDCDLSKQDMDKLIYFFVLLCKLGVNRPTEAKRKLLCTIMSGFGITLANMSSSTDRLLEKNVTNSLRQEFIEETSKDTTEKAADNTDKNGALESLTDSDLQTLLQNFKHLSSEEQHHLIVHLKKLEDTDPNRVLHLRKYVNISELPGLSVTSSKPSGSNNSGCGMNEKQERATSSMGKSRFTDSPSTSSRGNILSSRDNNYSDDENDDGSVSVSARSSKRTMNTKNSNAFVLDDEDEDDDYNYDDFFKANSSNLHRPSEERSRSSIRSDTNNVKQTLPESSADALTFKPATLNAGTQNVIANIMGSLQQSNVTKSNSGFNTNQDHNVSMSGPGSRAVPPVSQQPNLQYQQQHPHHGNMPYYQQQNAYSGNGYNQMNVNNGYYNNMTAPSAGYNMGYPGYQQPQQAWPENMQQQPQQYPNYAGSMNGYMYGRGH